MFLKEGDMIRYGKVYELGTYKYAVILYIRQTDYIGSETQYFGFWCDGKEKAEQYFLEYWKEKGRKIYFRKDMGANFPKVETKNRDLKRAFGFMPKESVELCEQGVLGKMVQKFYFGKE